MMSRLARKHTFARTVEAVKEVDEKGNRSEMTSTLTWDPETEARSKQGPAHIWECEEQQRSSSEGVNRPYSRPSEYEVNQSETPRSEQSAGHAGAGIREHSRRVERNTACMSGTNKPFNPRSDLHVDATHLLRNHDDTGSLGRASDTWNGE
jgi:hypothetical protein